MERKNKRTHSSSPISEHVIFTPFLQGRTVSRPVLTSVRARRDKIAADGPARLHVESKANTCNPSDVNLSFIHRVSKTPQSLRTCPRASYAFPGIAENLKDGWTENQRTRRPPCANALQCYKEASGLMDARERKHSIPSTISRSCGAKYNHHPPTLGTRSGHSPRLAPYIRMESDILLFCTMTACEGQACGLGFVKIEHWCWGPSGQSKSPCFTGRTGAAM